MIRCLSIQFVCWLLVELPHENCHGTTETQSVERHTLRAYFKLFQRRLRHETDESIMDESGVFCVYHFETAACVVRSRFSSNHK